MSVFKRKDPSKLQQQLEKFQGNNGFQTDDADVWKLEVDKQGNGKAVIRFLPGRTDEDMPFVKLINHGFRKNGKWYIENCTSTHGDFDSCPVCGYLKENDLFNTDKTEYQNLKRKTSYWANVLIVTDPAHPENVGKVFKYRFGVKIFDKIQAMAAGDKDLGVDAVDVTCPFDGADFILSVKKVGEHLNYDDAQFKKQSAIKNIEDDSYAETLLESMHDISSIASADKFKDAATLKTAFEKVMGSAARQSNAVNDFDAEMNAFNSNKKSTPARTETAVTASSADSSDVDEDLKDLLGDL